MPKPIVVLYIPTDEYFGPHSSAMHLMSAFNGNDDTVTMSPRFYDYLWFIFVDESLDVPELKVFHEKDYSKEQYDELKKMLEEGLNSLKNNKPK